MRIELLRLKRQQIICEALQRIQLGSAYVRSFILLEAENEEPRLFPVGRQQDSRTAALAATGEELRAS